MGNMERLLSAWIEDQNQRQCPATPCSSRRRPSRGSRAGRRIRALRGRHGWSARFQAPQPAQPRGERRGRGAHRLIQDAATRPAGVQRGRDQALLEATAPRDGPVCEAPGFKAARGLLTLLLGEGAASDFKLKPLLVSLAETPRVLRGCSRPSLPVVWRSLAQESLGDHEPLPGVVRALLLLCGEVLRPARVPAQGAAHPGQRPDHPGNLDALSAHVRLEYLPRNRDVISTFKACYLRRVFRLLAPRAGGAQGQSAVLDFCPDYSILDAIYSVSKSWVEVPPAMLNGGLGEPWPECIQHDAGGPCQETLLQIWRDIVVLAHGAGFSSWRRQMWWSCCRAAGQPVPRGADGAGAGAAVNDNDPNLECSLQGCWGVNSMISCYQELFMEKRGPK
ncbi:hypothetical protein HPG69_007200 [Diceros bicornis minor]|uniref:Uncharacterized protein n=1 Tax=Diceros bicornis minor TaxID=77932 RepID=A0A7J7FMZ7_DICBM|nr:hypothetical protein HPG69_007200 [Diceros bicornis minor]